MLPWCQKSKVSLENCCQYLDVDARLTRRGFEFFHTEHDVWILFLRKAKALFLSLLLPVLLCREQLGKGQVVVFDQHLQLVVHDESMIPGQWACCRTFINLLLFIPDQRKVVYQIPRVLSLFPEVRLTHFVRVPHPSSSVVDQRRHIGHYLVPCLLSLVTERRQSHILF